jgi:hypothetical protein
MIFAEIASYDCGNNKDIEKVNTAFGLDVEEAECFLMNPGQVTSLNN